MVGLVRSRDKMLQDYINGGRPMFMEVYDKERNSENWRVTKLVESLCEYIKYLEDVAKTSEHFEK